MMTEETKAFVFTCEWVGIGRGRLTLWHRPGARAVAALKSFGCDCVLTLLAAREHAAVIGQWVGEAGIEWLWLPLENGKPPQGAAAASILAALPRLSQMLDDGRSLFIHCAAGIHRTSMVAYALLRCGVLMKTRPWPSSRRCERTPARACRGSRSTGGIRPYGH